MGVRVGVDSMVGCFSTLHWAFHSENKLKMLRAFFAFAVEVVLILGESICHAHLNRFIEASGTLFTFKSKLAVLMWWHRRGTKEKVRNFCSKYLAFQMGTAKKSFKFKGLLQRIQHIPDFPMIFQDFQDHQESSYCQFQSCSAAHRSNSMTL